MERRYNLNIEYDYNNPILKWQPYPDSIKYRIYRGMSKEEMIKVHETNLLQYKDTVDISVNFDRMRYMYVISSVNNENEETIFTDYVQLNYLNASPYLNIIREILRRNNLILNRITGEQVDVYIKKQSGQRCPDCYNVITKDIETKEIMCDTCYNTSFVGGFEKVTCKIRIKNAQDNIVENPYGFVLESSKMGLISAYPFVNTGDFIRTLQGDIYMIDTVNHKRFQGFLYLQSLNLKLLETTRPEYNIHL